MPSDVDESTTVADPPWVRLGLVLTLTVLGAACGAVMDLVADRAIGVEWMPLRGPLEQLTELHEPLRMAVAASVGAVLGLVLAVFAPEAMLTVTVDGRGIEARRKGKSQRAAAADIASVHVADKHLVALGHHGEELIRVPFDLERRRLRAALEQHGYTWLPDGDPFVPQYRLWTPGAEGLPEAAVALIETRQAALDASRKDEAAELLARLAEAGVVVHDHGRKQYWRSVLGVAVS